MNQINYIANKTLCNYDRYQFLPEYNIIYQEKKNIQLLSTLKYKAEKTKKSKIMIIIIF